MPVNPERPSIPRDPEEPASETVRTLGWALIAWVSLIIVRNAWLSDDSFITFRTVENFVQGRGLTWNPGQRVQAFTHPAWFFMVSSVNAITHEMYYTVLALSIATSVFGLVLANRALALNAWAALPALVALAFSRAFIDYSTSGLENPLSHLLLIAWMISLVVARSVPARAWFDLLTGFALLNRLDLALLVGPTWLFVMWRRQRAGVTPRRLLAHAAYAYLPLLAWLAFSTFYFGFPFPNTAYAKLGIRIALSERFAQGFFYLLTLINTDPASALLLLVGLGAALRSREAWLRPMAFGALLYFAYIGYIGGDFMAGRFFSAPVVLAAGSLLRLRLDRATSCALALLFGVAGWAGPTPPMFSGAATEGRTGAKLELQQHRVMDERRYYYRDTGLLTAERWRPMPGGRYREEGLQLIGKRGSRVAQIGMRAFIAGKDAALVDPFGLTDPFLARLPAIAVGENSAWKAGHWMRPIPHGYRQTVADGRNQLRDPKLAQLYDEMQLITTGKLWSMERLRAIWRLNTGQVASPKQAGVDSDSAAAQHDDLP